MSAEAAEEALSLVAGLRKAAFSLKVGNDGKLFVSPSRRLTAQQAAAIRRLRDEMVRIVLYDDAPVPSSATIDGWYAAMEWTERRQREALKKQQKVS